MEMKLNINKHLEQQEVYHTQIEDFMSYYDQMFANIFNKT